MTLTVSSKLNSLLRGAGCLPPAQKAIAFDIAISNSNVRALLANLAVHIMNNGIPSLFTDDSLAAIHLRRNKPMIWEEIVKSLVERSACHDDSKFVNDEERKAFLAMVPAIQKCFADHKAAGTKGDISSPEYLEIISTVSMHAKGNEHHPEYHSGGIYAMDVPTFMEFIIDGMEVGLRGTGKIDPEQSIARFINIVDSDSEDRVALKNDFARLIRDTSSLFSSILS